MTSHEVLDLLNIKSGRAGDPLRELKYEDLIAAMRKLGIGFYARVYDEMLLTSYLKKEDIHRIAGVLGIDLYPIRPV